MKKFKKFLTSFALAILCVIVPFGLVGCGDDESSTTVVSKSNAELALEYLSNAYTNAYTRGNYQTSVKVMSGTNNSDISSTVTTTYEVSIVSDIFYVRSSKSSGYLVIQEYGDRYVINSSTFADVLDYKMNDGSGFNIDYKAIYNYYNSSDSYKISSGISYTSSNGAIVVKFEAQNVPEEKTESATEFISYEITLSNGYYSKIILTHQNEDDLTISEISFTYDSTDVFEEYTNR